MGQDRRGRKCGKERKHPGCLVIGPKPVRRKVIVFQKISWLFDDVMYKFWEGNPKTLPNPKEVLPCITPQLVSPQEKTRCHHSCNSRFYSHISFQLCPISLAPSRLKHVFHGSHIPWQALYLLICLTMLKGRLGCFPRCMLDYIYVGSVHWSLFYPQVRLS